MVVVLAASCIDGGVREGVFDFGHGQPQLPVASDRHPEAGQADAQVQSLLPRLKEGQELLDALLERGAPVGDLCASAEE